MRRSGTRRVASYLADGAIALGDLNVLGGLAAVDVAATTGYFTAASVAGDLDLTTTGRLLVPAGAVGTPSIARRDDLNTGIYFPAVDQVGLAAGGVQSIRAQSSSAFLNLLAQTNNSFLHANAVWADTPHTTQAITAAATALTSALRVVGITVDANYTCTAAPTVPNGTLDGQLCEIRNVGAANVWTVQDQGTLASSNLRLGATTRAIGPRCSLVLRWHTSIGDWCEVSFASVL